MSLKINKENDKHIILHAACDKQSKNYGNSVVLTNTLNINNKILKMRRYSNFVSNHKDRSASKNNNQITDTIYTRRMSLLDCSEKNTNIRNKTSNNLRRSIQKEKQRAVLQDSNINILKKQAAKLDAQFMRFSEKPQKKFQASADKLDENLSNFKLKINKKSNMRKIIKGRPQIDGIIKESRNKIFREKADLCLTQSNPKNWHMKKIQQNSTKNIPANNTAMRFKMRSHNSQRASLLNQCSQQFSNMKLTMTNNNIEQKETVQSESIQKIGNKTQQCVIQDMGTEQQYQIYTIY